METKIMYCEKCGGEYHVKYNRYGSEPERCPNCGHKVYNQ